MSRKRQVEVFTAGCPLCEPAVRLVQEMACPDCEVTIHDLREAEPSTPDGGSAAISAERARAYGVTTIPAVVVDGRLLSCCQQQSGPRREDLAAAGIGQRL